MKVLLGVEFDPGTSPTGVFSLTSWNLLHTTEHGILPNSASFHTFLKPTDFQEYRERRGQKL